MQFDILPTFVANCGHPESFNFTRSDYNDSRYLPKFNIEGHGGLPVEGSTIVFSCPPELGPISATCTENGEWKPDPSGLMCNDSSSSTAGYCLHCMVYTK